MGNKNSIYNIDLKDSFLYDAINTHNKHRADHNCPPLQHADDLSELAHKIAYYISTRNTLFMTLGPEHTRAWTAIENIQKRRM
jgi:uncharacterized protein YkwD